MQNISIRKFLRIICAGTILTAAAVLAVLYWLTRDSRIVLCGLILTAVLFSWCRLRKLKNNTADG